MFRFIILLLALLLIFTSVALAQESEDIVFDFQEDAMVRVVSGIADTPLLVR